MHLIVVKDNDTAQALRLRVHPDTVVIPTKWPLHGYRFDSVLLLEGWDEIKPADCHAWFKKSIVPRMEDMNTVTGYEEYLR